MLEAITGETESSRLALEREQADARARRQAWLLAFVSSWAVVITCAVVFVAAGLDRALWVGLFFVGVCFLMAATAPRPKPAGRVR